MKRRERIRLEMGYRGDTLRAYAYSLLSHAALAEQHIGRLVAGSDSYITLLAWDVVHTSAANHTTWAKFPNVPDRAKLQLRRQYQIAGHVGIDEDAIAELVAAHLATQPGIARTIGNAVLFAALPEPDQIYDSYNIAYRGRSVWTAPAVLNPETGKLHLPSYGVAAEMVSDFDVLKRIAPTY